VGGLLLEPLVVDETAVDAVSHSLMEYCQKGAIIPMTSLRYYRANLGVLDLCNRVWAFYRYVKVDQPIDERTALVKTLPYINDIINLNGVDPQDETLQDLVLYKILHIYHLFTAITDRFHEQAVKEHRREYEEVFPYNLVAGDGKGGSYMLANEIDKRSDADALEYLVIVAQYVGKYYKLCDLMDEWILLV